MGTEPVTVMAPRSTAGRVRMENTRPAAMIIVAHPDDAELGVAGTLLALAALGWRILILVLADGGRGGIPVVRRREQKAAAGLLGAEVRFLGLPDGNLAADAATVARVEEVLTEADPTLVFVHDPADTHQDHRAAAEIVLASTRRRSCGVLFCESYSSTNFAPDSFIDITGHWPLKAQAIERHASQASRLGLVGWAETVARFRGLAARCPMAEGFRAHRLPLSRLFARPGEPLTRPAARSGV
jgi:LmbE family N-acetylglucosaminyl deacetylase